MTGWPNTEYTDIWKVKNLRVLISCRTDLLFWFYIAAKRLTRLYYEWVIVNMHYMWNPKPISSLDLLLFNNYCRKEYICIYTLHQR